MIKEKLDYPTYIELAQKSKDFIDDEINKKMIDDLIEYAQQILEEKKHIKETEKKED